MPKNVYMRDPTVVTDPYATSPFQVNRDQTVQQVFGTAPQPVQDGFYRGDGALIIGNVPKPPTKKSKPKLATELPKTTKAKQPDPPPPDPVEELRQVVAPGDEVDVEVEMPPNPIADVDPERDYIESPFDPGQLGEDVNAYIDSEESAKVDLSPLIAYVDSKTGSNLLAGYKRPKTAEDMRAERAALKAKLLKIEADSDYHQKKLKNDRAMTEYKAQMGVDVQWSRAEQAQALAEMKAEEARKLLKMQIDARKALEASKPPTIKAPSYGGKGDFKRWDSFLGALKGNRGATSVNIEKKKLYAAAHGNALIHGDLNSLTPLHIKEIGGVMASQVSAGGAPALRTLQEMTPKSLHGDIAEMLQYLQNKPKPAKMDKFVAMLKEMLSRQEQTSLDIIKSEIGPITVNYADLMAQDKKKYDDMLRSYGIQTDDAGNIVEFIPPYTSIYGERQKASSKKEPADGTVSTMKGKPYKYNAKTKAWDPVK